jgi:hypothetical protein
MGLRMSDDVATLLEKIRSNASFGTANEEALRQAAILPLLRRLGWDPENLNEVAPEWTVEGTRVDYCLRVHDSCKVFLEVKRPRADLDGPHEEQLLSYAFKSGVPLAVLTNGVAWWFYLPLMPGEWRTRKFVAVNICDQDVTEAADRFRLFLGREQVASGEAERAARALYEDREKLARIREYLPKAWREMCESPSDTLVELVAEKVEGMCGHRPEAEAVRRFLSDGMRQLFAPPSTPVTTAQPLTLSDKRPAGASAMPASLTDTRPRAFAFRGMRQHVSTHRDILRRLLDYLLKERGKAAFVESVRRVRRLKVGNAHDGVKRHAPYDVAGSGLMVEINFSATDTGALCQELVEAFGFSRSELSIELV